MITIGARATDQSDAGRAGIFSRQTNRTQDAWVYSHDGPIYGADKKPRGGGTPTDKRPKTDRRTTEGDVQEDSAKGQLGKEGEWTRDHRGYGWAEANTFLVTPSPAAVRG
eukprot:1192761-Prorocentrum_minimum.AAC.4